MDKGKYYGYIVKGDLRGAINYVKQFPEQTDLYNRFMAVFDREQYISYEVNDVLNDILTAYQQYYRDVFYLCTDKEQSEASLRDRLTGIIGITDNSVAEANVELCDLEQHQLAELFQQQGFHFLGGRTSGFYGPYVWRTTEIVSYDVELPEGIQTFPVKFLDGFIARSWTDYLSFGEVGSGGWVDSEGYINCVKSAWDFDSESFRISLLKHEAQHARDLQTDKEMSSEDLEYRAKLVELIYSDERNLLPAFAQEADSADKSNGHAMAAYRIIKGFSDALGVDRIDPTAIPMEKIQTVARRLFEKSKVRELY
ncbi:MAG TPA: hypothetical protein DCZ91_12185 [Lachnospiraceae bacterium]|nr:hypothetical protein [Lachnospiraceae bacterium]